MNWRDVVVPNRIISKSAFHILILVQIVVFLVIWNASSFVFLPKPSEVLSAFVNLWSQEGLAQELMTSFTLNVEAILITSVISLLLAYATTINFFRPIVALVTKGRFLSLVGLTFFFTMMFNGSHELKLSLLVFGVMVFMITSMVDVVTEIPREKFDLARTLGMNEWQVVWEVIVLGKADVAFDVIRQNAAMSWMMITMVEGISRSEGGVGALLLNQNKHFNLAAVFAIQITILLLGLAQDYGIGLFKRIACPYAELAMEKR